MTSEECAKCWFNYIQECDGQENFKEDDCMKKNNMVEEETDEEAIDTDSKVEVAADVE